MVRIVLNRSLIQSPRMERKLNLYIWTAIFPPSDLRVRNQSVRECSFPGITPPRDSGSGRYFLAPIEFHLESNVSIGNPNISSKRDHHDSSFSINFRLRSLQSSIHHANRKQITLNVHFAFGIQHQAESYNLQWIQRQKQGQEIT